jgi:predicted Zn-dependent peptidase
VGGAGLAYACAAQPLLFSDAGVIVVQVQAPAGQVQRCRETAERCLDALAARGPDPARVQTARRARLARAVLAGDDAERRARALAASRSGRREDQADAVPGPCVPAAATLHLVV